MARFPLISLLFLGAASFGSAHATDLSVTKPGEAPVVGPWNWTGIYVGGHIGGALEYSKLQDPFGTVSFGDSVTGTGFIGGGQVGADYQIGNVVIGGAGDLSWASSRGDETCFGLTGGAFFASNCSADPTLFSTITGRLGYAFDRTLVYAKGGAAWEHNNVDMTINLNPGNHFLAGATSYGEWGWTLGAGVEYALTPAWSIFSEYDYLSFASHSVATPYTPGNPLPGHPNGPIAGLSNNVQEFKLGLNYKFGADPSIWPTDLPVMSLKAPLLAASGWEIEAGARYMHSWGRAQWEQAETNPTWFNSSKLTWNNLQTNSPELFGRVDSPWNVFLSGFIGTGETVSGGQNDEDFHEPAPDKAYNNTYSTNNGSINYAVVDLGYDVLRQADYKVGPFVGYTNFNQYIFKFGCQQVASTTGNCSAAPLPSSQLIGLEDMTWQALRVGVSGQVSLTDRVKLTTDVAYLPYVTYNWLDDHLDRDLQNEMWGHGVGIQTQAVLSYDVTDRLSVGIGGRYWAMWSTSAEREEIPFNTPEANRNSVELLGAFVQASYRFDPEEAAKPGAFALPIFKGPVVGPAYDWTGLYGGIEGGGVFGESKQIGQLANAARFTAASTPSFGVRGGMVGGTLGYNSEFDRMYVFGFEGDMSWVDASGSVLQIPPFSTKQTASTSENWLGTARVRLGVTPVDRWLVYATGGLALADVEAGVAPTTLFASESHVRTGWTAGGGVEMAITGNLSAKLEYLHVGLENHAYFVPTPNDPHETNRAGGVSLGDNIVRAGLNYRIDWQRLVL
jgi:opacity protein-like surface antigen